MTAKDRKEWAQRARRVHGLRLVREGSPVDVAREQTPIKSPRDVVQFMAPLAEVETVEVFWILCLDSQHRLIGNAAQVVTRGILNFSLVHPREVFRHAIVAGAAAIILCHNHPSGDPTPSADDRAVTEQLVSAGRLLDIPVHDHIIIGRGRYTSMSEAGLLSFYPSQPAIVSEQPASYSHRTGDERPLTHDERALLTHVTMWGSTGYPLQKIKNGRRWTWCYRSLSAPQLYKSRRECLAAFEQYLGVLRDCAAGEAFRRAKLEKAARDARLQRLCMSLGVFERSPRYGVPAPFHCLFCGSKLHDFECHNAECFGRFITPAPFDMESLTCDEGEGEEEYEQRLSQVEQVLGVDLWGDAP